MTPPPHRLAGAVADPPGPLPRSTPSRSPPRSPWGKYLEHPGSRSDPSRWSHSLMEHVTFTGPSPG